VEEAFLETTIAYSSSAFPAVPVINENDNDTANIRERTAVTVFPILFFIEFHLKSARLKRLFFLMIIISPARKISIKEILFTL
jgi:hypothetical protein